MEQATPNLIEIVFATVLAVLGISFIMAMIFKYQKYDDYLVDANANKSTSHYTVAYADFEKYEDTATVLNNILSYDYAVVEVDSRSLTDTPTKLEILEGARNGGEDEIRAIKAYLTGTTYKVSYIYDNVGIRGLHIEKVN